MTEKPSPPAERHRAPRATPVLLRGVAFDTYLGFVTSPDNAHLRMTYRDGILEIMPPAYRHERGAARLTMLVSAYAAVLRLKFLAAGSSTFSRGVPGALRGQGKEPPDASFYFGDHADLVLDKGTLDLNVDPPPDLWIEVDNRGSSRGRLPVYAGLGVPEVWRYRPGRRALWFGRLEGGRYVESDRSVCLPKLTPGLTLELLDHARTRDDMSWDLWLRDGMAARLRDAEV